MGTPSLTGQLLIAAPLLRDPNFARTVVLMLDHDGDGALGVVINRATEIPVTSVLSAWSELVRDPGVVFSGGPVATDSALGVADVTDGVEPLGWRRLYGTIGLVDLDAPPELLADGIRGLRIFAGYAGWGPGQLESEVEEGGWYIVDADADDPFTSEPDQLWNRVLRRQPGELAFVATFPEDPLLN